MIGMRHVATYARQTRWPRIAAAVVASTAFSATIARYGVEVTRDDLSTGVETDVPLWVVVPTGISAAACVLATWLSLTRPFMSSGLMLVVTGWLAPSWADDGAFSPRWRVALLAAGPLVVAGVGLVIGATASPRHSPRRWPVVALAGSTAAVAVTAFGYNPFEDPNCRVICSASPTVLRQTLATSTSIAVAAALTLVTTAIVVTEILHIRPPRTLVLAASLTLVPSVTDAIGSLFGQGGRSTVVLALALAGVGCLGAVIAIQQLRTLSIRRAVEGLADELSAHE